MEKNIAQRGYWLAEMRDAHVHDPRLAAELCVFFAGKSVVDMGCGLGLYVNELRNAGVTCAGYDGNPLTPDLTAGACSTVDLSYSVTLGKFDWVLSLEVGEHIPSEYEAIFVDNLHRHNRDGIVLSWAIPNQGGDGHCNWHTNAYVKELISSLGYVSDDPQAQKFRRAASLSWFKNTIMVFRRI